MKILVRNVWVSKQVWKCENKYEHDFRREITFKCKNILAFPPTETKNYVTEMCNVRWKIWTWHHKGCQDKRRIKEKIIDIIYKRLYKKPLINKTKNKTRRQKKV